MAQVDIIVPLYNKAATVKRAIDSIVKQQFTDWRLIVVDDGSTDGGGDIVSEIADERIELIRQENRGPGAARNAGIALIESEYVAFLDADDEWYRWYLQNAMKAIGGEGVAVLATMYDEYPRHTDMTRYWMQRGIRPGTYSIGEEDGPALANARVGFLHVGNTLMRTEIARKYDGFYAEQGCRYGEDSTFFFRVAFGEAIGVIEPAGLCHHREASDLSGADIYPTQPYLENPDVVLRYCPAAKKELMGRVLARRALGTARNWARHGMKGQAQVLLGRFPQAKTYRLSYYRCRYELALSRFFPLWIRFKCAVRKLLFR